MPPTISRVPISGGDAGVHQTLALMAQLVDEGIDTPAVVQLARLLAVTGGVRRQWAQAIVIQSFLKRVWRFVEDPFDRDLLLSPGALVQAYDRTGVIAGDCDEAAILGAALGRAVGLSAQFVVLAFPSDEENGPDAFSHVYAVLLTDDGKAVSLDVTRPAGPVPPPTRALSVAV